MTITLALPSKGRLKDDALEVLAAADLRSPRPTTTAATAPASRARRYRGRVSVGLRDRARARRRGRWTLASPARILLRETIPDWQERVAIAARLGFGRADVVVAVPEAWLDVDTMADLDDVAAEFRQRHGRRLRIATKYWRLTQDFFSRTARHPGLPDRRKPRRHRRRAGGGFRGRHRRHHHHRIDAASANHLKVLADGVILKSEACLFSSIKDRTTADQVAVNEIAAAVAAL